MKLVITSDLHQRIAKWSDLVSAEIQPAKHAPEI